MSGINLNHAAQSNGEFTSFTHPVVKVPESLLCYKGKLMVDYISMKVFFSPGATTPMGVCILQPSSGL